MIWFSADFHLSHKNIIKYCNRPFQDVEVMDNTILGNLRTKLKSDDILYYLGDLTFYETTALDFFKMFKDIKIHYIIGNHDNKKVLDIVEAHCESVSRLKDITIEGQDITLCHYAMRVWNNSHFNSWQLYGHSHAVLEPIGKQYDVGVDNTHFFPISFEEIAEIMKNRPDNFNFIPPERRNK